MVQAGKKDLIYKSAKKLFNKYGIKKVSIDMIVNKAWVAKGTFYLYYENKHQLYVEIINSVTDQIKQKIIKCENDSYQDVKTRLMYDFVGSFEFFESQNIFKQIARWNQDYFSWDINTKTMQTNHIKFLKEVFENHLDRDIDFELLAKIMWFYKHLDTIKIYFSSKEEFDEHKIKFAAILIEGFFADYQKLCDNFDTNKINKLLKIK